MKLRPQDATQAPGFVPLALQTMCMAQGKVVGWLVHLADAHVASDSNATFFRA